MFVPGTLWPRVAAVTAAAQASGALLSVPTSSFTLGDRGSDFAVRIVAQLARKPAPAAAGSPPETPRRNPFLPYDPELFVADLPPHHVCLLNKYNVVDRHLLVVTREFEGQQTLLTRDDFQALAAVMGEGPGVGFYNSGPAAGASQPHKHLQWVPVLPSDLPLARVIELAARGNGQVEPFQFVHAVAPLRLAAEADAAVHGAELAATYESLLRACGIDPRSAELPPYNLILTHHWMIVVPRACELVQGISLNALAFTGALLVKDEAQAAVLRTLGPWRALEAVTCPRRGGPPCRGFPHVL